MVERSSDGAGDREPADDVAERRPRRGRDENGIALGGVCTPAVDAPVAVLSGENDTDNEVCALFGSTMPFTPEQLARLYATHQDYVDAVTDLADAAVDAGFLLPNDRDAIVADAEASSVPR